MALWRIRLERTRRRAAWTMAAHPDRRIHRCDRIVVRNCVRQCHRGNDSAPFVSRGANASDATALGSELHHAGDYRPARPGLACRAKPAPWPNRFMSPPCRQAFRNERKFDRQFAAKIFDQFTRLSAIALQTNPPPDLLIWPESSMPGPVLEDDQTYRFVMDFRPRQKRTCSSARSTRRKIAFTMRRCSSRMPANGCKFIANFISCRSANTFHFDIHSRFSPPLPADGCQAISMSARITPSFA